jgi:hypothetical protein
VILISSTVADATPVVAPGPAGARRSPAGSTVRGLRAGGPALLQAALLIGAGAVWINALRHIDPRGLSDLGLVTALPPSAFGALALATLSFAIALRHEHVSTPLAVLHIVVLVVMLHGATSLMNTEPPFNVVWRHAGVTDYVLQTGTVDPDIDAYFNWPGFFFLTALATRAAGLHTALGLSGWAPVMFELLYLPALVVISRTFTSDRRLAWTAVWIFYMTNWVGQDYLSPQAVAYLLYLAVVAVVLTCFTRTAAPDLATLRARGTRWLIRMRVRRPRVAVEETGATHLVTPGQRSALVLVCVVLIAVSVASHQLTPWMMLSSLTALVLLRRCTARGLPVITLVLLVAWLTYLAAAYLDGHLKPLLGQTLDVQQAVAANVGGRLQGSQEHLLVVRLRLVITGLVWTLAAVGLVRGLRRGIASPSHLVLALAPAALALLQPYGGEMLMRVYVFTLPFTACYAAQALLTAPGRQAWLVVPVLTAAAAVLVTGFLFTRYGNVRTTVFTRAEVHAVNRLYDVAPRGSLLLAVSPNLPWKQRHYADYRYQLLSRQIKVPAGPPTRGRLAAQVARYMAGYRPKSSYLILTRSQKVYDAVLGAQRWGSSTDVERSVTRSPQFAKVFDDGDGKIFVLRHDRKRAWP